MQWFIDIIKGLIHSQLGYFHRSGVTSVDFDETDLTADNTWHDLDLSSIVPSGVQAVNMKVNIRFTDTMKRFALRRKGETSEWNTLVIWSQAYNVKKGVLSPLACDSNRIIQYKVEAGDINSIDLVVCGWWMR